MKFSAPEILTIVLIVRICSKLNQKSKSDASK